MKSYFCGTKIGQDWIGQVKNKLSSNWAQKCNHLGEVNYGKRRGYQKNYLLNTLFLQIFA